MGSTTGYKRQYPINLSSVQGFRLGCVALTFISLSIVWDIFMCVLHPAHYSWLEDVLISFVPLGMIVGCLVWLRRRMIGEGKDNALIAAFAKQMLLVAGAVICVGFVFRLGLWLLPDLVTDTMLNIFTSKGWSQSWAKITVISSTWICGYVLGWFVLGRPLWRRFDPSSLSGSSSNPT